MVGIWQFLFFTSAIYLGPNVNSFYAIFKALTHGRKFESWESLLLADFQNNKQRESNSFTLGLK